MLISRKRGCSCYWNLSGTVGILSCLMFCWRDQSYKGPNCFSRTRVSRLTATISTGRRVFSERAQRETGDCSQRELGRKLTTAAGYARWTTLRAFCYESPRPGENQCPKRVCYRCLFLPSCIYGTGFRGGLSGHRK